MLRIIIDPLTILSLACEGLLIRIIQSPFCRYIVPYIKALLRRVLIVVASVAVVVIRQRRRGA
jgi:hypothetical protein